MGARPILRNVGTVVCESGLRAGAWRHVRHQGRRRAGRGGADASAIRTRAETIGCTHADRGSVWIESVGAGAAMRGGETE